MKFFKFLAAISLASLLGMSNLQAADEFFEQSFGDYSEELAAAKADGKQGIFMFFEMEECPFCHRMKTTIINQPEVAEYFGENFNAYKFDIEGSNPVVDFDGTEFATEKEMAEKKYRVRATPVMIIVDLDGNPVARFTGPTRTKEEFLLFGKYVVEGAYKDMPFNRYKRAAE